LLQLTSAMSGGLFASKLGAFFQTLLRNIYDVTTKTCMRLMMSRGTASIFEGQCRRSYYYSLSSKEHGAAWGRSATGAQSAQLSRSRHSADA
jgi:hypothetical protein